jgi:predicted Zn-dependent protease
MVAYSRAARVVGTESDEQVSATCSLLERVIAHKMGHVIGSDHCIDDWSTLMCY